MPVKSMSAPFQLPSIHPNSTYTQGFGGKVEAGESIHAAALRELHEEAGIHSSDATKCGLIRFEFEGDAVALLVHVFRATQYTGTPQPPFPCVLYFLSNPRTLYFRNRHRER